MLLAEQLLQAGGGMQHVHEMSEAPLGLNQQVDRTATMNPVLICLLVMVTFFFLLCDAARTGLAQGRAISPSP